MMVTLMVPRYESSSTARTEPGAAESSSDGRSGMMQGEANLTSASATVGSAGTERDAWAVVMVVTSEGIREDQGVW